jgi:predicted ATPase
VILSARPSAGSAWDRPGLLRLDLSRLGHEQAEAVVGNVTRGKALPREVLEELIVKADGVPLFLEELTRTILASKLLQETAGEYRLMGELSSLNVPDTLRGSLIARLDRLEEAQGVAKLAAVLGRQFTYEMISAVSLFSDADLGRALELLVQAELLERGGTPPQVLYTFRHALLRDAAYDLLLKRTRQQYHRRVADTLVEKFREIAEAQPETVAQHYSGAGLAELAAGYWLQAGNRALHRSANLEAIGHLEKGLDLLGSLPESPARDLRELEIQMALGTALSAARGYVAPEVERAYFRANELSRQIGDSPGQIWILQGLRNFYIVRGDLLEAQRLDLRMVETAESRKDPDLLIAAYGALATSHLFLGNFSEARDCHERALASRGTDDESFRSVGGLDLRVMNRSILSIVLWILGRPDSALRESRAAMAMARETGHPFSVAVSLVFGGVELHQFLQEPASVGRYASDLVAISRKHEFPLWQFQGELFEAWAGAHARTAEEAGDWPARLARALADLAGLGGKLAYPYFLGTAVEAWLRHRNLKEAWPALEQALALAEDTNDRWWNAELYRLQGELILAGSGRRGAPRANSEREAESAVRQGLETARRQGARSLELRSAMSLARLWKAQGSPAMARELVKPVYQSFEEGFETRDLRDARALLESCRVAETAPTTKTRRVPVPADGEGPLRTPRSARRRGDC